MIRCTDCLAVGDTDAEGWTHGRGEDDSHRCPACSEKLRAEDDGFACEHEATEWPTAEPPPDDMVSDAVANADAIRAAVEAEREEIAAMIDGMASAILDRSVSAANVAAHAMLTTAAASVRRRRAIVRLP